MKCEIYRRQHENAGHPSLVAGRALPQLFVRCSQSNVDTRLVIRVHLRLRDRLTALGELGRTVTIGEEAVGPYSHEALGQKMQEKTS